MQKSVVSNSCYSIHFTKLDVTIKEDWIRAWDEAEDVLGGKIEILCNNAGITPGVRKLKKCSCVWICILHHFQAGVDDNISIMGVGNTQGAMYALKKMQLSNGGNGGRIITTAAIAGLLVRTSMVKIQVFMMVSQ